MGLFDYLLRRAPTPDQAPEPAVVAGTILREPDMSFLDDLEICDPEAAQDKKSPGTLPMDLGDTYAIIEYHDSKGAQTTRRVTLMSLTETNHGLGVNCICHERRAYRLFRVDRISGVIDEDSGEVVPFGTFFAETYGCSLPMSDAAAQEDPALTAAKTLRDFLRPALGVLVSAARADGKMHISELDAIQIYAEKEMFALQRDGRIGKAPTIEVLDAFNREIERMRPQRRSLRGHLEIIMTYDKPRQDRIQQALEGVIQADGRIVADEIDYLNDIASMSNAIRAAMQDA
ncbi:tellurite resistance TerB family protein [Paenirhodobacter enshiensis]|uniref:WYL domain-containing protein n=1 Tax=Paenirhodobacter enshiensis TaxID=1105367 RepID=A0A086XQ54_9RHOB|nr:hypothetical protein [Paenirhodobacter enshiensis]KFI24154.1 hypothetical protein CG50_13740 [Paenirhodobacter enshiensis]